MKQIPIILFTAIASSFALYSCHSGPDKAPASAAEATAEEPAAPEWISLFDGSSTQGWRGFNRETLPENWVIEDGTLKSQNAGGEEGNDIVYGAKEFGDFELSLEWKISEGGNSGILYHVLEGEQYEFPYETGPEYQLIDDIGFPEKIEDWQQVGADYAMYPADPAKKIVKKAGEWNASRIVFTQEKAEYWLNGQKVVEFVPWSDDWTERRNSGKWDDYPDYGNAKKGLIALQDHGSFIWFRNIKIREL